MIVDLNIGLDTATVDALEWEQIDSVNHSAETAEELAVLLGKMPLSRPSAVEDEDWDYKDCNIFTFNMISQVAYAVEGLEITGQSEGPRYWFISFIYKGKEAGIGPGYNK